MHKSIVYPPQHKNYRIVNARAFAILSVMFGHSIILYSSNWNLIQTDVEYYFFDCIKDFINIYQMPLWFAISGFLFYKSIVSNSQFVYFTIDKARRLLVPYICVGLLWMIPIRLLSGFLNLEDVGTAVMNLFNGKDNGHLWYLYALFVNFVVVLGVIKVLRRYMKYSVTISILLLVIPFVSKNFPDAWGGYINIGSAMWYMVSFLSGIAIHRIEDEPNKMYKYIIFFSILASSYISGGKYNLVVMLAISLFLLYSPNVSCKPIEFIDLHSYGMYLLHSPLIYIPFMLMPNIHPLLMALMTFGFMGVASTIITYALSKSRLKFMIGLYKKV